MVEKTKWLVSAISCSVSMVQNITQSVLAQKRLLVKIHAFPVLHNNGGSNME